MEPARACSEVTFWRPAARIRSPLARTASSKASCDSPASAASGSGMRCSSATSSLARRSSEFPVSGDGVADSSATSPCVPVDSAIFGSSDSTARTCSAAARSLSATSALRSHGQGKVWSSETGSSGVFHASPTTHSRNRGRVRLRNSRRAGQVPACAGSRPHRRTGCPVRVPR